MKSKFFTLLFALGAQLSFGQIIFHYNGGTTYFGSQDLDMDNDGYPEYEFKPYGNNIVVTTYGGHCVGKGANIILFNDGQNISSTNNWYCTAGSYSPIPMGGTGATYLGLKFVLNGQFHYGWVNIDINTGGNSFVLWSWAYNSVAGQPIQAGYTSAAGVNEWTVSDGIAYVASGMLQLSSAKGDLGEVSIYTIAGQKMYGNRITSTAATIDVSSWAKGVYVLRVGNAVRKIQW